MEKILRAMGQDVPENKKILEINPEHPLFEAMNELFEKDATNAILGEYSGLLYDQALILEGSRPRDAAAFAKSVAKLMAEKICGVICGVGPR
jgi:molecular chaperone HtpG